MFEFWLKNEDEKIEMLLPVSLGEYEFEYGNSIETISTTNFGDVNISGHRKLSSMILRGFFPKEEYEFAKKEMEPMEYVKKIQSWVDKKLILRLIIVDGDVAKVNSLYKIESITHSENSQSNGDVNYVITLRDHKKIEATKIVDAPNVLTSSARDEVKTTPKMNTYTVVSGDSLSRIARKMYGDASKWPLIYNANINIIKNKDLIYVGQVFVIPQVPKSNSSVSAVKKTSVNKNLLIENTVN